ncbi:uncharacterized protein LOC143461592 [Clavelina lepadiformis]|uniref:uncharacterized protein LOC143461592 n=1 Tax=Clavelina lepadiformis TaxID=159417 RepID=UPI0040429EB9
MKVLLIYVLLSLLAVVYTKPSERRNIADSGHLEAEKDILIDACPRIKKPLDPLKYKLLPTLIDDQMEMCCGCDDGELNVGPCTPGKPETTRCVPCPDGTYNDELAHNKTQCKRHVNIACPPDRIHVDGGKTEQHRCDCREGSFLHNGKCRPHTPCPDHYGVKIRGNFERDTVCEECRVGYNSPDVSATAICTLMSFRTTRTSDVTEPPRSITSHQSPPPISENPKSEPGNKGESVDNNGGIGIALILVLIFIPIFAAVIVVLLCCCKRKLPKRFRNFLSRNNRTEGVEAKENEAGQLLDSNDAFNKGSRNISIASFSNVDEDEDVKRSEDLQQKPFSVKGSSKLENVKDYEVVECHSLQFSAPVAEDGLVKARPTSAGPSASSLSGHRASYSLTFSDQFTRKMRDLGNDLSEAFSPQDINLFYRKFSKAKYPENVIHYIELGPDRPRPSEKFIKLFNELMKHGEDHFNSKLIHGFFEKKDWMTYALVVEEKFPELRIASDKNSPHYSRADTSQS